ncbi:extracellular solute-binding protein [Candidatus Acetatifactor stercoripullorum]|uniref:extracellular solute-binding protein n=1 Tax=Candidatus Acetatifactor stercoripullorum TaxID=2838414 RepID=UPI00298DA71D|nr:extracellular solute-binding protein [Candidatus Acetatifactor stercoripullorum]
MRKKWFRKGMSLCLTAAMALGLTACGGTDKVSADPNLAKQYVYSCQDIEIPQMGDSFDIQRGYFSDGKIYLLANVYNWNDTGSSQELRLISLNEDGTGLQEIELQTSAAGSGAAGQEGEAQEETPDEEAGQNQEETGDNDLMILPRAEAAQEETDAETDVEADVVESEEIEDMLMVTPEPLASSVYEYTGYANYTFTGDGMLYAVKTYSYEDYSDPENVVSRQENSLCKWDMAGTLLGEYPLETIDYQQEYAYISSLVPLSDGGMGVLYTGDGVQMSTVDAQGNVSERKQLSDSTSVLQNASNFMVKPDGVIVVTYYDESDWSKMYIATYDPNTDTLSEGVQMPESFSTGGYNSMTAGTTTDLIVTTSNGVYSYNIGDTEPTQMMSFVNSDMNISSMSSVIVLDDTRFVGLYYDSINYDSNVGIFTKVDPEDIPDKKVLVLAANYVNSDVRQRVVDFNKSSDQYRIVLREYQSYATTEDYNAGYTQLNNDIISGNMPDILVVDANTPVENYISKGLIADVGSLIESDEELSQTEFMQNVFEAYSIEGKLYQVIPYFNVMTLAGKKSIVGDRTSWTMAEFEELEASLPEGTAMIGELTRSSFMNMMMRYCGTDFVDVSTGKCNFDSQNFIDILEFANELPENLPDDYYNDDYWNSYESQYRENRTVLMYCYISSVRSMNYTINGSFGEEISFIGFPTESGNGSSIDIGNSFALSARSENLEGAWEFVRYYLTDEYQETVEYGLPISSDIFTQKAQEALNKPYYLDENGNKVEYSETFYMNGENIELEPMTQEQIDQVVEFIRSVNTRSYYNQDISKILEEEVEAYFTGQKSAKEVAQVIQSRAQIYVSENR